MLPSRKSLLKRVEEKSYDIVVASSTSGQQNNKILKKYVRSQQQKRQPEGRNENDSINEVTPNAVNSIDYDAKSTNVVRPGFFQGLVVHRLTLNVVNVLLIAVALVLSVVMAPSAVGYLLLIILFIAFFVVWRDTRNVLVAALLCILGAVASLLLSDVDLAQRWTVSVYIALAFTLVMELLKRFKIPLQRK